MFHFHRVRHAYLGAFICLFLAPHIYAGLTPEDLDWSIRKVSVAFERAPQDMEALQQAYTEQKQHHPPCAELALLSLNLNATVLRCLDGGALARLFQELYNTALWIESQPNYSEDHRHTLYDQYAAMRMNEAIYNQFNIPLNRLHL